MSDPSYRFQNEKVLDDFLERNKLMRHEAQILPLRVLEGYPKGDDGRPIPIAYALIGGGIRIPHDRGLEIRTYRDKLIQDLEAYPDARLLTP